MKSIELRRCFDQAVQMSPSIGHIVHVSVSFNDITEWINIISSRDNILLRSNLNCDLNCLLAFSCSATLSYHGPVWRRYHKLLSAYQARWASGGQVLFMMSRILNHDLDFLPIKHTQMREANACIYQWSDDVSPPWSAYPRLKATRLSTPGHLCGRHPRWLHMEPIDYWYRDFIWRSMTWF